MTPGPASALPPDWGVYFVISVVTSRSHDPHTGVARHKAHITRHHNMSPHTSQGTLLYLHIILKTIRLFPFIIDQVSSCVSNPDFPDMFTVAFVVEKQNGDPSLAPISEESKELQSFGE